MYNKFNQNKNKIIDITEEKTEEEGITEKNSIEGHKIPAKEIEAKVGKEIIGVIKNVEDPELGIDIWSLELIYDINVKGKKLNVMMTFTSPTCPYGQQIVSELEKSLKKIGYEPNIELVFSPPWKPSGELKEALGLE